jgi:hypothetical protein
MESYRLVLACALALVAIACNAQAPQAPPPPPPIPPPPIVTTSAPPLPPPPPPVVTAEPVDAGSPVDAAPNPNARKLELEAKVFAGRGNADEVHELMSICIKQADRVCIERVVGVAR